MPDLAPLMCRPLNIDDDEPGPRIPVGRVYFILRAHRRGWEGRSFGRGSSYRSEAGASCFVGVPAQGGVRQIYAAHDGHEAIGKRVKLG